MSEHETNDGGDMATAGERRDCDEGCAARRGYSGCDCGAEAERAEARFEITRGADGARLEAELVALRQVCADLVGERDGARAAAASAIEERDEARARAADLAERLRSAEALIVDYAREHTAAWAELPECTGDLAEAIRRRVAAAQRPVWVEWGATWLLVEGGRVVADVVEDGEPPRVLWTVEGAGQGTARDAATGRRIVEAVIAAEGGARG